MKTKTGALSKSAGFPGTNMVRGNKKTTAVLYTDANGKVDIYARNNVGSFEEFWAEQEKRVRDKKK